MFYQMAFPDVTFIVSPVSGFDITKENWYKSDYGIHVIAGV